MRTILRGELQAPSVVIDLDAVSDAEVIAVDGYVSAYCLLRDGGLPDELFFVDLAGRSQVTREELRALLRPDDDTRARPETYDAADLTLSVVICTRDRLDGLRQTVESLCTQDDPRFSVIVVDNSSSRTVPEDIGVRSGLDVRVVHQPTPGLSHARNLGLANVTTDLISWIDDDEIAAPDWIRRIREGFGAPQRPDVVSGLMLPAQLETPAQVDFERYGGFNKGRGLRAEIMRAGTPGAPDPFYPLPNFGAGGNMTFRTQVLRDVGGFEPHLGAGTLTHGGEETLALSLVLHRGGTILHWPSAVTWHFHRRTMAELEKQFFGYSAGLSAFYMSLLLTSPRYLWRVVRLIPRGIADLVRPSRAELRSEAALPADFPKVLLRASKRGLLCGAALYLREQRLQKRRTRDVTQKKSQATWRWLARFLVNGAGDPRDLER